MSSDIECGYEKCGHDLLAWVPAKETRGLVFYPNNLIPFQSFQLMHPFCGRSILLGMASNGQKAFFG